MFEYYGGWATKIEGDAHHVSADAMCMVWKEPMGVAVGITPWNYPLMMAAQKVAPAIAAGCTFILKPPEQTPLTCIELPKILEEAGLPAGVFHVLTGFGETAGAPLVAHPGVDKVGFTGSIEIGTGEATLAARGEKPDDPRLAQGYFVPPTIFADVTNAATIAREEILGPVMSSDPVFVDRGRDRDGQRQRLRARGRGVDAGHQEGSAHRAGAPIGGRVDQRHASGADRDAVGRVQAVRDRSGAGQGRRRGLPREEVRVSQPLVALGAAAVRGRLHVGAFPRASRPAAMITSVARTMTPHRRA
jgi:Aldehyde dehydrogenase family